MFASLLVIPVLMIGYAAVRAGIDTVKEKFGKKPSK